jgi:hypothetical protein
MIKEIRKKKKFKNKILTIYKLTKNKSLSNNINNNINLSHTSHTISFIPLFLIAIPFYCDLLSIY